MQSANLGLASIATEQADANPGQSKRAAANGLMDAYFLMAALLDWGDWPYDLRIDASGVPFMLESNANCGFFISQRAMAAGISASRLALKAQQSNPPNELVWT